MIDEQFEVRFLGTEQDFIYNFGVNKGHSLSYPKVNRCYFLSAEAKQLYHNICDYAWGGKRDCHPSQAMLRLELGWSKMTMDKYLKELREAGLISCESQGVNKPLIYYIAELRTVAILIHSELIHQVREDISVPAEQFYASLNAYKESKYIKEFVFRDDMKSMYAEVKQWFIEYFREDVEFEMCARCGIHPPYKEYSWCLGCRPELKEKSEPSLQPKRSVPTPPPAIDGLTKTSSLDEGGRKGKTTYDPADPSTWTASAFRGHFERLYERKYSRVYQTLEKDVAQLSRLLKVHANDKELVRSSMEAFFDLDYFTTKTLAIFCSAHTQSVLDEYMRSGKLPFRKQQPSQTAIPDSGGGDEYDDIFSRRDQE